MDQVDVQYSRTPCGPASEKLEVYRNGSTRDVIFDDLINGDYFRLNDDQARQLGEVIWRACKIPGRQAGEVRLIDKDRLVVFGQHTSPQVKIAVVSEREGAPIAEYYITNEKSLRLVSLLDPSVLARDELDNMLMQTYGTSVSPIPHYVSVCPDCGGTGKYEGLYAVESCRACQGGQLKSGMRRDGRSLLA